MVREMRSRPAKHDRRCPITQGWDSGGDQATATARVDAIQSCFRLCLRGPGPQGVLKHAGDLDLQLPPRVAWTRFVEIGGYAGFIDHLNQSDPPPPPPPTETGEEDDKPSWLGRMGL